MYMTHLELSLCLAEDALKQSFSKGRRRDDFGNFSSLRRSCRNLASTANARRIYAKLMKMELNRRAVAAVVHSLPADKQKYLRLKYRQEKGLIAVSLALHVSVPQLNLWHRSILAQVARFMHYTLCPEDVLYPGKVADMVMLLADATTLAKLDPDGTVINGNWRTAMENRLEKYRELSERIDHAIQHEPQSLYESIVATRLAHPFETAAFVADACHTNEVIVSRYLRKFSDSMGKYLS